MNVGRLAIINKVFATSVYSKQLENSKHSFNVLPVTAALKVKRSFVKQKYFFIEYF